MKQTQTLRTRLLPKATSRISSRDWMVSSMVRGELRHARPDHDHSCVKQKIKGLMLYDRSMIGHKPVKMSGVKEAVKELRKIDPELRKQFNKDAKAVVRPVVDAAKGDYPSEFLSGMLRPWTQNGVAKFPYVQTKAKSGVKLKVDTRGKAVSIISILQNNPAAAIVDMAGKKGGGSPRGEVFIANLTKKFGNASRIMWPSFESHETAVSYEMTQLIGEVMKRVSKEI
jgi:hypothetical protein